MTDCLGCGEPIGPDETPVHADEGTYHMGCEFREINAEVSSGGFGR